MWGAFSDEVMCLSFTVGAVSRQRSLSRVQVPQNSRPYFIVSSETPPTWRARSPRNRVTQFYHWALGSPFVASCDSQGYGGGVLAHLHPTRHLRTLGSSNL
jgi:hypothetical protein